MTDEEKKAQEIQAKIEREAKEKADKILKDEKAKEKSSELSKQENQISPLEEARALDKSIKASNIEMKKLLERNEKTLADSLISGKGFAGQPAPKTETEDEKWAKEAKLRYAGTGMSPVENDDGK